MLATNLSNPGGGTVGTATFFANGTIVGTDPDPSNGIFFNWQNVPTGSYTLTANIEVDGELYEAGAVQIEVETLAPPSLTWTSPTSGATYDEGEEITLTLALTNPGTGSVGTTTFYANGAVIGTDDNADDGISFIWTNVDAGTYLLNAVVDVDGIPYESDNLQIIVETPLPPTLSWTSPSNGETFDEGEDIMLTTVLTNPGSGIIGSTAFYVDGSVVGTDDNAGDGISFNWADVSEGTYYLDAEIDIDGNLYEAGTIQVIVESTTFSFGVSSFTLWNSETDQIIQNVLADGDIINLNTLGDQLSIEAVTNPRTVGSVHFKVNGNSFQTENVVPYAIKGDTNGDFKPWSPAVGTYTIEAIPYSKSNRKGEVGASLSITIEIIDEDTPPTSSQPIYAITAGGPSYTATDGTVYSADQYFTAGKTYTTSNAIGGTEDDLIYQSERYGNFNYVLPIADDTYEVEIEFAEIYWNNSNKRVFDVLIEGELATNDLDIYADVGKFEALTISGQVEVNDGFLDIQFLTEVNHAKVAAIVVRPIDPGNRVAQQDFTIGLDRTAVSLTVAPNPAWAHRTVEVILEHEGSVELYGPQGHLLRGWMLDEGRHQLSLYDLSLVGGLYTIRHVGKEGINSKRLMIITD